jgi:hypothetical protein
MFFASALGALPGWFSQYAVWWVAAIIVVGGVLIFGRNEITHLRIRRIWAISDVSFAESIRRRVLWVTPFAILGVIAISLLQHTSDPQDSIRQTIKYCLFASGLLVTLTAVILASTNLPREIENRVIFTVVTKPITRLEIVLGKVLGFIRVSGVIVIIMGVFSFGFLEWQNWQLSRQIAERLKTETDPASKQTLIGYQTAGLLNTKSLELPLDYQAYDHFPSDNGIQWITGGLGYSYAVPFAPNSQDESLLEAAAEDPPRAVVFAISTLHLKRNKPTKDELDAIKAEKRPIEGAFVGPTLPGQSGEGIPVPQVSIQIYDGSGNIIVPSSEINEGKPSTALPQNKDGTYTIPTALTPEAVRRILTTPKFYVSTTPETLSVEYEINGSPTVLDVRTLDKGDHVINPVPDTPPRFSSANGRYGMQIIGTLKGDVSIAEFPFRNVPVPANGDAPVEFRFRGGIQRSGDYDAGKEWSAVALQVVNRKTHEDSGLIEFHPETNRDIPVTVPAKYVAGGDFNVYVRGMDAGQWIGMTRSSVQFIAAEHSFIFNLFKSLLILWLYSVLVVVVAVFSSTFLSWPIAIVLTLVILLGHWGVDELGDALNPGVGRSVAQDLGFNSDPARAHMVSASVEALARSLTLLSSVLPDLSKFPVMDDITRGVSIPMRNLLGSIGVLLSYGLPMLVLSFIIFKNKEVAP